MQAVRALAVDTNTSGRTLTLAASGDMAVNALHAAIFAPGVAGLELERLPESHRTGPDYLNVLRILDVPAALAVAADGRALDVRQSSPALLAYRARVMERTR